MLPDSFLLFDCFFIGLSFLVALALVSTGDDFAELFLSLVDLMALLELSLSSFFTFFPAKIFRRLLASFFDLILALGEEDGLDELDWLTEGVEDFSAGVVRLWGRIHKIITKIF